MSKDLTLGAVKQYAVQLGVSVPHILTCIEVESGGQWFVDHRKDLLDRSGTAGGFLKDGRCKILYESHIFYRQTNGKYGEQYPISSKSWGKYPYGTLTQQWNKFVSVKQIEPQAAIESCSWGLFQVLGANWQSLGYDSAQHFYDCMVRSENDHLDSFVRFIRINNLVDMLKQGDSNPDSWRGFARRYNGPAYEKHNYHGRLATAYDKHAKDSKVSVRYQTLLGKGDDLLQTFRST